MDTVKNEAALLACFPPNVPICVADRCSCVTGSVGPAVQPRPRLECKVSIAYPPSRPDLPALQFSGGDCAVNADIALAFALATLLRHAGPLTPVPK